MFHEHSPKILEVTLIKKCIPGRPVLLKADEERTLARLRALRSDLFDPTIALHHGRVVKRTGDGVLVEFRSVVDAVRCAIEVQNGMAERNAGLPPERRIEFRIGIHLGDVVEESDGDLMGDGVNIAARLEGIAILAAGSRGPCVSRARSNQRFREQTTTCCKLLGRRVRYCSPSGHLFGPLDLAVAPDR